MTLSLRQCETICTCCARFNAICTLFANFWSSYEMYTAFQFWTRLEMMISRSLAMNWHCKECVRENSWWIQNPRATITQHAQIIQVYNNLAIHIHLMPRKGNMHILQSFTFVLQLHSSCCHEQPYLKGYLARRMECSPAADCFQVLSSVGGKWRNFDAYEPKAMVRQCEEWSVK
jgi:hypothetical protein